MKEIRRGPSDPDPASVLNLQPGSSSGRTRSTPTRRIGIEAVRAIVVPASGRGRMQATPSRSARFSCSRAAERRNREPKKA